MSIKGFVDCACAEFDRHPMPEAGPKAVWLPPGDLNIRKALKLLVNYELAYCLSALGIDYGRLRYHGGVHVGNVHVNQIFDDAGRKVFPVYPERRWACA